MATKTLTITEEVYRLLTDRKMKHESFSQELARILSKKRMKTLGDFFGIISEEEGAAMLTDLEKIRAVNTQLVKKRLT